MNTDMCQTRIVHKDKVETAKKNDLSKSELNKYVLVFKALSDPGRLRILNALLLQEMCVCDLAAFLDVSESSVSHQLRLLRTTGLVTNRRDGNVLYYRTLDSRLRSIFEVSAAIVT